MKKIDIKLLNRLLSAGYLLGECCESASISRKTVYAKLKDDYTLVQRYELKKYVGAARKSNKGLLKLWA